MKEWAYSLEQAKLLVSVNELATGLLSGLVKGWVTMVWATA